MKHFYLITNWQKKYAKELTNQIQDYLIRRGCICIVNHQDNGSIIGQGKYTSHEHVPETTECVITLGGDGTLIQAARDLVGRQIPLIGINLGTLGYLTQMSRQDDIDQMLEDLIDDHYQLESRMMLSGKVFQSESKQLVNLALNEIVITRKELLKVLKFRIYVNGECFNEYTADGILVATPTGSTAYNLSAGGPIAEPSAKMIILTPICPHSLNTRSIVLSAEAKIQIEILGNDHRGQVAVFDGDAVTELMAGDYLEIAKHHIDTVLVKLKQISFFDNLRSKMSGI